jgi:hypothetical protein
MSSVERFERCEYFASNTCVIVLTFLSLAVACGGAGNAGGPITGDAGGSGGNGGGGGSSNNPTTSLVAPSQAMSTMAVSLNPTVFETNFTPSSKIEISGTTIDTSYQSPTEPWGFLSPGQLALPGVYSVTVRSSASRTLFP